MLTYTFSTREKFMLGLLAIIAIVVAWYQLVFVKFQDQMNNIDAEVVMLQDQITIDEARAAELSKMRSVVEDYEAQGYDPVLLPPYDNTQNLMAYLNSVLGSSLDYSMSFDDPAFNDEDQMVHRTGTISFETATYEDSRRTVEQIARGPYPCEIVSLGIADGTKRGNNRNSVSTSVQLTFFEKSSNPNQKVEEEEEKPAVEGHDLSALNGINQKL